MTDSITCRDGNGTQLGGCFRDITSCRYQWLVVLTCVAVHTAITFLLPFPGCPTGYLGPGGVHDHGAHANCTGGSATIIDISVFGADHIYRHPTARRVYATDAPYDPEGLLGALTSVFLVYCGAQAAKTMLAFGHWRDRVRRWLAWAVVLGLVSGGLCGFSKEGGIIPVNKNLWSLSFVTATASMAFVLLSIM